MEIFFRGKPLNDVTMISWVLVFVCNFVEHCSLGCRYEATSSERTQSIDLIFAQRQLKTLIIMRDKILTVRKDKTLTN